MAAPLRRLLHLEKWIVTQETTGEARWLVLHFSYSDGGEVYEVRSLQGPQSYRRFATESELQAWLRQHEHYTLP